MLLTTCVRATGRSLCSLAGGGSRSLSSLAAAASTSHADRLLRPRPVQVTCVRHGKVRRQRSKHEKQAIPNFVRLVENDVRKRGKKQALITRDDRPQALVWRGMTLDEFAKSTGAELDDVFEVVLQANMEDQLDSAESKLDLELLNRLCRLLDFRMMLRDEPVPLPTDNPKQDEPEDDIDAKPRPKPAASECVRRAPVVTIMGHVDHGKTTLLDALRDSQIVDTEFGGITQHIGAFKVRLPASGKVITFLDTPGHAAFHSIRRRGANATDIVILVVAADDGVMEQTVESIRFANAAGVPIVVAINKCDRYNIDIERTKQMLRDYNVVDKELGGDVDMVPISALKRTNLDRLQQVIVDKAVELNLQGDPAGLTEGVVIESKTDQHLGKLCTVLVQRGRMSVGQCLVAGRSWCRVRSLIDEYGSKMKGVDLSMFAEVSGWREELAEPGSLVLQVDTEKRAKEVVAYRQKQYQQLKAEEAAAAIEREREEHQRQHDQARLHKAENLFGSSRFGFVKRTAKPSEEQHLIDPSKPRLPILLKTDVEGSLEAIMQVLDTYESDKCALQIVDFGLGPPSQLELDLAKEFNALIYLFNVPRLPAAVEEQLKLQAIEYRHFNVIYHFIDDLKATLSQKLPLKQKQEPIGEGVVLKEFQLRVGRQRLSVAGVRCERGSFDAQLRFRVSRGQQIIADGALDSMKRERDSVETADVTDEVGLMFHELDTSVRFEPGDTVVCYRLVTFDDVIDWAPPGF